MEGFRGLASAWVFIGHICILVQCNIPILGNPSYGVDLFVLLSGFLMTKNYIERRNIEPWNKLSTVNNFWVRRFFRIAPLYYVLLAIAILLGPYIGSMRDIISEYYPNTATGVDRFTDQSVKNIVIHASLLFGLSPEYSFRTTLPDWSIGLEVQYYLLFPFLMFIGKITNLKTTLLLMSIISTLLYFIFPDFYKSFPMPSFILLKLPIFIAGMFIYIAIHSNRVISISLPFIVIIFATITHLHIDKRQLIIQLAMCALIIGLLKENKIPYAQNVLKNIKWLFNNKFCVWLGDVSYSVYLIHLLIVTPVIGILIQSYHLSDLSAISRLLLVAAICAPIVYSISYLCFKFIEKPGINLGKKFIKN